MKVVSLSNLTRLERHVPFSISFKMVGKDALEDLEKTLLSAGVVWDDGSIEMKHSEYLGSFSGLHVYKRAGAWQMELTAFGKSSARRGIYDDFYKRAEELGAPELVVSLRAPLTSYYKRAEFR